jgi:hypothetical protein
MPSVPLRLHHGTTLHRARAIIANGPDPHFTEPGSGRVSSADGFSTVIGDGRPCATGTPTAIALAYMHSSPKKAVRLFAHPRKASHPPVTIDSIADFLDAPLEADWTVDRLAERLLESVARRNDGSVWSLVVDKSTGSQARRLIRPLLACLASKAGDESGVPVDPFGGTLSFIRSGPNGEVAIDGEFENRPGQIGIRFTTSSLLTSRTGLDQPQKPAFAGHLGNAAS